MWNEVNWKKRDSDIARELGVSRERVRQKRQALGKPKVVVPTVRDKIVHLSETVDLTEMTVKEIAEAIGHGVSRTSTVLKELGINPKRGYVGHNAKYDWDAVDWEWSNEVIAQRVGAGINTVASRRSYLKQRGKID